MQAVRELKLSVPGMKLGQGIAEHCRRPLLLGCKHQKTIYHFWYPVVLEVIIRWTYRVALSIHILKANLLQHSTRK